MLRGDSTRLRQAQANTRGPLCLDRCSEWQIYFVAKMLLIGIVTYNNAAIMSSWTTRSESEALVKDLLTWETFSYLDKKKD